MNRTRFYAALRKRDSGVFGTRLSQAHVDGINAILAACGRYKVTDQHHVSQILAQVYKETGGYMRGIKETVYPSHKNKNPSDATVIARLDAAWRKGQLKWVKTPYWRDGAFGRGPIQTTHWHNYDKIGAILGVDLRKNPNLLVEDADIGAASAVIGMMHGIYTGKKLSDYRFPGCLDTSKPGSWKTHPRRIVNGKDGTDAAVSELHWSFFKALTEAGYSATGAPVEREKPPAAPSRHPDRETPPQPALGGFFNVLFRFLAGLFGGK